MYPKGPVLRRDLVSSAPWNWDFPCSTFSSRGPAQAPRCWMPFERLQKTLCAVRSEMGWNKACRRETCASQGRCSRSRTLWCMRAGSEMCMRGAEERRARQRVPRLDVCTGTRVSDPAHTSRRVYRARCARLLPTSAPQKAPHQPHSCSLPLSAQPCPAGDRAQPLGDPPWGTTCTP